MTLHCTDDDQVRDLPYGMLIYGGFDGQLNNDVLLYVVGSCASLTKENCLTAMPGVKCVWHKANKKCVPSSNTSEGYERCSCESLFPRRPPYFIGRNEHFILWIP